MTVASNFVATNRTLTRPAPAAEALKLKFTGSSVLLFGEATPRSGQYRVTIDGTEKEYNARVFGDGVGRLSQVVAEGLDPAKEHTLEIQPVFVSLDQPVELRLESICIAGPDKVACNVNFLQP